MKWVSLVSSSWWLEVRRAFLDGQRSILGGVGVWSARCARSCGARSLYLELHATAFENVDDLLALCGVSHPELETPCLASIRSETTRVSKSSTNLSIFQPVSKSDERVLGDAEDWKLLNLRGDARLLRAPTGLNRFVNIPGNF